jgi:hypothetical protein
VVGRSLVGLTSSEKIVIIIDSGSVVGGSCELVGIITEESALASQEV